MADALWIALVLIVNGTALYVAVRVAWWAFRKIVRGTGTAWRGEAE